jgi:hypothetical protein
VKGLDGCPFESNAARVTHAWQIGILAPRELLAREGNGWRIMSKLNLSVAIGDYDRNRPLIDGAVQIDGVDPVFMKLYPEEIFFRAFRTEDFDVCECSLSSFAVKTAAGDCPYVGVPASKASAYLTDFWRISKSSFKQTMAPTASVFT